MMGDNRDNSTDSRFLSEVGFVPVENLVGRAEIIFFSIGEDCELLGSLAWPADVRWSRILQVVRLSRGQEARHGPRSSFSNGLGHRFEDRELCSSCADPFERRGTGAQAQRGQRAAGIPRRPRPGARRGRAAVSDAFPMRSEGELARRYNQLVRAETCAEIARKIGLGQLIFMSGGEADSGGRDKKTILADACEALLGAIFIDGGYRGGARCRPSLLGRPA